MNNNNIPLHQEDDIVFDNDYDFSDSFFDLNETLISKLGIDFKTPIEKIKLKFKNCEDLLKLGHVNVRSLPKHIHEIERYLLETLLDIFGVSETFISENTPQSLYQIPGYKYINKSRDKKCRGGVGLFVNENFPVKVLKLPVDFVQPEMLFVEVTIGVVKMAVGVIYKSPLIPYSVFAAIHENIVAITSKYEHVVIMGDMNINHLLPGSSACKFFTTYVTEPFALTQVITEPTRITATSSTLIDLMLTSSPENVKAQGVVDTPGVSDHCMTFMANSLKTLLAKWGNLEIIFSIILVSDNN